jgi:hypothetical protein
LSAASIFCRANTSALHGAAKQRMVYWSQTRVHLLKSSNPSRKHSTISSNVSFCRQRRRSKSEEHFCIKSGSASFMCSLSSNWKQRFEADSSI